MPPGNKGGPYATTLGAVGAAAMVAVAGITLALAQRRRRPVYTRQEWDDALQEDGAIAGFDEIVEQIEQRGIEPHIRADVWPFLLEVFDHTSTYAQRQHQHYLMTSQYQQLLLQCQVRTQDQHSRAPAWLSGTIGKQLLCCWVPAGLARYPWQWALTATANRGNALVSMQAYEAVLKESLRPASPSTAAPAAAAAAAPVLRTSDPHNSSSSSSSPPQASMPPAQQHPQLQQQLPEQVRQFAEAHRIIVIDSVRTDFQKHAAALQMQPDPPSSHNFASAEYASSIGVAAVAAVSQGLHSSISTLQQWQQHWLGSLLGGQAAMWGHTQAQWVSEAAQLVLDSSTHLPDDSKRQASRMIAMLSAYALHDPDTGYCQGMSDLLLPFLLLMDDDALAFWCFVSLMQRMGARHNFAVDERGIFGQLRLLFQVLESSDGPLMYQLKHLGAAECHFAYRMVVVMMRRDMPMPKVLHLWEVLWAYSWQQRRSADAAVSSTHAQAVSPSKGSSPPASPGQEQDGSKDGAGTPGSPMQLVVDARSAGPDAGVDSKGGKGGTSDGSRGNSLQQQPHLQLFICFVAAVIQSQRRTLLDHCYNADDVLRLFHSVRRIDLWQCLDKAHQLLAGLQQQQEGGRI